MSDDYDPRQNPSAQVLGMLSVQARGAEGIRDQLPTMPPDSERDPLRIVVGCVRRLASLLDVVLDVMSDDHPQDVNLNPLRDDFGRVEERMVGVLEALPPEPWEMRMRTGGELHMLSQDALIGLALDQQRQLDIGSCSCAVIIKALKRVRIYVDDGQSGTHHPDCAMWTADTPMPPPRYDDSETPKPKPACICIHIAKVLDTDGGMGHADTVLGGDDHYKQCPQYAEPAPDLAELAKAQAIEAESKRKPWTFDKDGRWHFAQSLQPVRGALNMLCGASIDNMTPKLNESDMKHLRSTQKEGVDVCPTCAEAYMHQVSLQRDQGVKS